MQVTLGIQNNPRELSIDVEADAAEVQELIAKGITSGLIVLEDKNGRKVMIPAAALGYVELGGQQTTRVGFIGQ